MTTFGLRCLLRTSIRSAVAVVAIALLLSSVTHRASAEDNVVDPVTAAMGQPSLCEVAGGTATVNSAITVASGLMWVDVQCTGGMFDGMSCTDFANAGVVCVRPERTLTKPTRRGAHADADSVSAPPTSEVVDASAHGSEPIPVVDDAAGDTSMAPIEEDGA